MDFLKAYLWNLFNIAVVASIIFIFLRIFFPATLVKLFTIGHIYGQIHLWPIIIIALLLIAVPWRRE